jgi:hypothetical protein
MRIRCSSASLPQDLMSPRLATLPGRWPVTLDAEYEVLGLNQQEGLWYVIFEHHEREMPVSAPLALFEVIERKVAASWNVRVNGGEVSLQPAEFDDEFFCDDVQERRGDALERYRAMKARLGGG